MEQTSSDNREFQGLLLAGWSGKTGLLGICFFLLSRSFFLRGSGMRPSRCACFLASLRARRIASPFSRVLRSEGFSMSGAVSFLEKCLLAAFSFLAPGALDRRCCLARRPAFNYLLLVGVSTQGTGVAQLQAGPSCIMQDRATFRPAALNVT
jgi:hypothetical protein